MPPSRFSRVLLCTVLSAVPACAQVDSSRTSLPPTVPRGAARILPLERTTAKLSEGAAAEVTLAAHEGPQAADAAATFSSGGEVPSSFVGNQAESEQASPNATFSEELRLDDQSDSQAPSLPGVVPPAPEPLGPETPGSPEGGLTLAELEQIALENNPTLRQAIALVQQAQGNWLQVGLYPNPTVGYTAGEIGQADEAGQQGAFVAQNIVTADKLDLNRAVTSWDVERARWQVQAQELRVLNLIRLGYYEVLTAQRRIAVLEQLEQIAQQGVDIAQQLVQGQQAPRTDVLQAQIDLSTIQLLLRNARHQERAARRQLASAAGIPELPPVPIAGTLEGGVPVINYEKDWQRFQTTNPILQIARTQVERARAQLRREQVQPVPDVQLQGSVQQDFASDFTIYGVQAGIMLPIHNRNQGNITAAVAELRRATEEVERIELVLRQQLAEAHRRYEIAHTQVQLYRESILPRAEETLRLATEGYRAGEIDFLRVLTARRTYFENYVNYVVAQGALRQALVEIEGLLLTGGLDDPSELPINPGGGGGGTRPLTITPKTE